MHSKSPYKIFESALPPLSNQLKTIFYSELNKLINYSPTIGLMGKSGVGKSSLCNALFQAELAPVSDVEGCTRQADQFVLDVEGHQITFIDLPGIGEDVKHDEEYYQLYVDILPKLDLVLWILKADDRAWAAEEQCYNHLIDYYSYPRNSFLFILNQADKIEPYREWLTEQNEPSQKQQNNLQLKIDLVNRYFNPVHPVIAVSASEQYQLDKLALLMINALPCKASSAVTRQLKDPYKTELVLDSAKNDFGNSVGNIIDDIFDLISLPRPVRQAIYSVKEALVSFAKSVWNLFF